MMNLQHVISNICDLRNHYTVRNGYVFTSITSPANIFDAIVIRCPARSNCFTPKVGFSDRSLRECIELINKFKIKKALIIAENIDFIAMCPTLEQLQIIPADSIGNGFDYSPLYTMPQIKRLRCLTKYGRTGEHSTIIDCSKIKGLEDLSVNNSNWLNYENITTLKSLSISHSKHQDLNNVFSSIYLDTLEIVQCKIKSLDGVEKSPKIQCLYLHYNKYLNDISALKEIKHSLRALRIENCPKIEDFTALCELEKLELLELTGGNELPDLSFITKMRNLKTFVFNMNVKNGDLSPCLRLSYVYSEKNRKHYNLRDTDLPKGMYVRGNETIEPWRRVE